MFKNTEVKRITFFTVLLFLFALLLTYLFNQFTFFIYKQALIENNSYMISSILVSHPELEEEVIDSILSRRGDYQTGLEILKSYGLDNSDAMEYLDYNAELKGHIQGLNYLFTILVFGSIVGIYYYFLKKQYNKIGKIDLYMNNILNNDYGMDIREYCEGDISNLKNDIYKMTVKLKEQSDISQKDKLYLEETLSDISHQIRTPLTSMYVINDILGDDKLSSKDKKAFLAKNKAQLERIEWLVTSLLKMSRLDSGSVILKPQKNSLQELIFKAVEPLKIPIELKDIELVIQCDEIDAKFDMNWTVEALVNIIKNACEHTPVGGRILIAVCRNPIYTEIRITDSGEGIGADDLPHVFERFYKGKHNKESIGIGLNMARKIVTMQEGDIEVFSKVGEGTTFVIKLYKHVV